MSLVPDRITPLTQAQFSETYGGSLICCMVSLPIYGISLLQAYLYYSNYPHDSRWVKSMVALLLVLESAHTWMTCHTVYHYSILSYSNPLSLIDGEWSVYTANALGIPVVFLIQIYFSRMVYHLVSASWKLAVFIVFSILVVAQIGFGIYVSARMFIIWKLPDLKVMVLPALVPLYCIRLVSDTLTTVALCVVLYDASTNSLFNGSNKLFKTLMLYAMNRFILTTTIVIVQTIVLIAKPTSIWAMVIEFVTVHLYVNSVLASLNARQSLRTMGPESNIGKDHGSNPTTATFGARPATKPVSEVSIFFGRPGQSTDQQDSQPTYTMSDLAESQRKTSGI